MDAFYKAHVASTRTRGSGNLDEDIAAIEAEIRKVQHYRSKFRSYRVDQRQQQTQLNSCGNSECSDEEEVDDASPTSSSVFKVYNSSCNKVVGGGGGGGSPHTFQKSPDIFTWAAAQQVQHDHNYCCEVPTTDTLSTAIDHGTINITNIQWQALSPAKRAHAVQKLSCILQQKPSGRHSPTFSSLDWLPNSFANWIRKTGTLAILHGNEEKLYSVTAAPAVSNKTHPTTNSSTHSNSQTLELRSLQGSKARHRRKPAPYSKLTRQLHVEVTRVRNISSSSCSEEDAVVID